MSGRERFHRSSRAPRWSKSPERSASLRLFGHGSSQWKHHQHQLQRSESSAALKKPPETLRRAVADCLSSAGPNLHGGSASLASLTESGKTLRDYFVASATTDMAYNVLLEHTLAERDRSPAVVSRCVALLKRYLMRYVPKVETLQQIDDFCANFISECNSVSTRGTSSLSSSSATSVTAALPSLPASNYASPSLLKSLHYVQSLVIRYIPKPFQPVSFSGASNISRQSLPSLSSLLNKSFNSQLNSEDVNRQETSEIEGLVRPSALDISCIEKTGAENDKHIPEDIFKWRWNGDKEQWASSLASKSLDVASSPDARIHGFLEVGAAALFVGDVESKLKGQLRKSSNVIDISDTDRLLLPSTVTTSTSFASASNHLKAITASKRMKPGPHQVWLNVPVSTFHPRTRTLFHYRHYSEQQPLRLNPDEVCDVIAAVCLESCTPNPSHMTTLKFSDSRGKPSTEVAVSVLIKLIIDMYIMDSGTAAPFTLFMLEDMLSSSTMTLRVRVFDIILNLGVHGSLLEPMFAENSNDNDEKLFCANTGDQQTEPSAIENFESWILVILYEILLVVVQTGETEEIVWASGLSCLLYFICDKGKIQRKKLEGLDIRVMKAFLDISRKHSWSEIVHQKLISILANMCYQVFKPTSVYLETMIPIFDVEQVYLLGGINFICMEYAHANLRQEKQDLFFILLDYVCDQINESIFTSGGLKYNFNEIQPLATMLALADAPEAFYIAIKHGVEGVGEILRRSMSIALCRSTNSERLNSLLEKIMRKLDSTISAFTCLDNEFLYMSQITKSYKSLNDIKYGIIEKDVCMKAKLSWSTLHFLLHSERSSYRHNGYIWLVELLLSEIIEGKTSICSSIKILQKHIVCAGSQDSDYSFVPIPVSLFCGLLNSKHNFIRWGFLFVLEKFIVRCKLILDENKVQRINSGELVRIEQSNSHLEKANTLIDIMSCGLLLLDQKNETDRINILKMCGILFSQLSLVIPVNEMPIGYPDDCSISPNRDTRSDTDHLGAKTTITVPNQSPYTYEYVSMASLLLRSRAIVPMQLVARVPTSLLYWPLIQLAGAATDDIALGNAVGSKGCGDLPGGSSDIRAALLLLLNCKCTVDPSALSEVGGKEFFRGLLDDTDSRVSYYSSAFLLKRMIMEEPEKYQWLLQNLTFKAQQSNNEKLLENPYLQMRGILQLLSDLGSQL